MIPIWKEVGKNLFGHIGVGAIDCSDGGKELCSKYKIQGVPSIKLFTKDDKGETYFIDFPKNSERTVDSFVAFVKPHQISHVIKISSTSKPGGIISLEEFLSKDGKSLPHVILFKVGKLAPSMGYKTLSVDYKGRIVFGIANISTDYALVEKLNLTLSKDEDSMVIIPNGKSNTPIPYKGGLKFTDTKAYLDKLLSESNSKEEL